MNSNQAKKWIEIDSARLFITNFSFATQTNNENVHVSTPHTKNAAATAPTAKPHSTKTPKALFFDEIKVSHSLPAKPTARASSREARAKTKQAQATGGSDISTKESKWLVLVSFKRSGPESILFYEFCNWQVFFTVYTL